MASREALDDVEDSEEFRLLVAYCTKRSRQRSRQRSPLASSSSDLCRHHIQDSLLSDHSGLDKWMPQAVTGFRMALFTMDESDESSGLAGLNHVVQDGNLDRPEERGASALTDVAGRLVQIADSAPIPEADLEADSLDDQDVIIQKLVELLKTSGDVLDDQIKQDKVLQQRLRAFNYALFERLTSSLQSLVDPGPAGQASVSEDRVQREKIAWAFEVTSKLSAVDVVPKRRALAFGERYIRLHHSVWVQQHGGWEKAFDSDDID